MDARADTSLAHALPLQGHVDPGGEFPYLVQAQVVDLLSRRRRGGATPERDVVIGVAVLQPPAAAVVHGASTPALQQIHLPIEGGYDSIVDQGGGADGPLAVDPLLSGAPVQGPDERGGLTRRAA